MESNEQIDNSVLIRDLELVRSHSLSCIASKTEQLCLRLYNQIMDLSDQKKALTDEVDVLKRENASLSYENESLKRETEEFRAQRNQFRSENDVLRSALTEKENLFKKLANEILNDHSFNNTHHVVNSLPSFTHTQFAESVPISLNQCSANDSYSNLKDLRLTQSKDQNAMPSQTSSMSNNTSASDTYMTANSRPSIPISGTQNVVRSLSQNSASTSRATHVNGISDSLNSSFSIDEKNNIRLKPAKVILNRQIDVDMSFIVNPSNFWIHVNYTKVNNYIHHIQVTQQKLLKTNDYALSCKDIYVGMYCVAIYSSDGEWYRAQVIAINYEPTNQKELFETVKLIYIDWGNTEDVHISKITKLTDDLSKRKQAVKCYLQGIKPEDNEWPKEIVEEFKRMISGQRLCAVFHKPESEENANKDLTHFIYPVDLVIISNNCIESIVDILYTKYLYLLNQKSERNSPIESNPSNDLSAINKESELLAKDVQNICNTNLAVNDTKISNTNNAYLNFNGHCSKQHNSDKSDSTIVNNKDVTNNLNNSEKINEKYSTNSCKNVSSVCSNSSNSDSDCFQIPPPIIPSSESLTVVTSYVCSPSEFFVHIHGTEGLEVGIAHLDDLYENLQTHYNQSDNQSFVSDLSCVTINSFWVCKYKDDDYYYRVRVIGFDKDMVEISYVDYGNTEFVHFKELIPLTRRFASYPALCAKCSLYGVSPLSDEEWSMEAIRSFTKLSGYGFEEYLTAFIGYKPENFNFNSKLEVILWAIVKSKDGTNEILINAQLVAEKLAHTDNMEWVNELERIKREKTPPEISKLIQGSIKSGANISNNVRILPESLSEDEDDIDWDPKAEDYYSTRNNYAVNTDDPGTATMGFQAKDVLSCKYFGTQSGCRMGDHCQFPHIPPEKRFAIEDKEEEHFNINGLDLEVGAYFLFKVTGIQSPYSFYGILPFGDEPIYDEFYIKTLLSRESSAEFEYKFAKNLYTELKTRYSRLRNDTNPDIFHADGSLVVAKDDKSGRYFRARVLNFDDQTDNYKLFHIDSGFNIVVHRSSVFKLEKYFAEHPALAVHCSLKGIEPYSNGPQNALWSPQAIESFTSWALDKLFCIQVLSKEYENKITVELIHYIGEERESISEKLIHHKFAQPFGNFYDDEIYPPSDLDSNL